MTAKTSTLHPVYVIDCHCAFFCKPPINSGSIWFVVWYHIPWPYGICSKPSASKDRFKPRLHSQNQCKDPKIKFVYYKYVNSDGRGFLEAGNSKQ